MDALLARLGVQAMNYAIRSGIALTSTYAISQCSRLLKTVDDKSIHCELKALQKLLNSKIKIISPAIDLIEFKSGRGNTALESAAAFTKALREDIASLGSRLENAATLGEDSGLAQNAAEVELQHAVLLKIITDIKELLARIDRDIPVLQLAITASGESLSTSLPSGISPSRLLQASTFLIVGDTQYANEPSRPVQIGPSFTVSLYMLFLGHSDIPKPDKTTRSKRSIINGVSPKTSRQDGKQPVEYGLGEHDRKPLWQEVMHKARVRLCRTPLHYEFDDRKGYCAKQPFNSVSSEITGQRRSSEYAYHLEIIEDLDDGRVHEDSESQHQAYDNIKRAGIRESIPIYEFSKIFYADTGRILNIGHANESDNNPVLLLKRDKKAALPQKMAGVLSTPVKPSTPAITERSVRYDSEEDDFDEQEDIDRQILEESRGRDHVEGLDDPVKESSEPHNEEVINTSSRPMDISAAILPHSTETSSLRFPSHLDPEWIALEVFEEDNEESSTSSSNTADDDDDSDDSEPDLPLRPGHARQRSSLDARIITQIKNLSLLSSPPGCKSSASASPLPRLSPSKDPSPSPLARSSPSPSQVEQVPTSTSVSLQNAEASFVARSPFGSITSSLSLLEMLIRLTSLQEYQQASHLSIPDHILVFFLEETSTTGLKDGAARWRARNEARRRVGFDPYTDTPR